jgi:antitoxin (DNA-binding transcriptional repressor) of toxin-antitoxin stability system
MARVISQRDLRNDNAAIMREIEDGNGFIVTRHGHPVAELTPLRRHRFVSKASVLAGFSHAPDIDRKQFQKDIDAVASQDIDSRLQ